MTVATLTIRKLDETAKKRLREHAAARGVSMEKEARERLSRALAPPSRARSIIEELRKLSIKPDQPIDLKKLRDELWDESLE